MKMIRCLGAAIFFMVIGGVVGAIDHDLDGTTDIKYPKIGATTNPAHYVFRDGNKAQGIVCLCNGFTVLPATNHGSNLYLDTNISISGGIDLRGTSTMTLLRDIYLDSGVTFSDSGCIYGYGSALRMGGDLTIPADKVLHCGGNFIIDGGGHTLHLNSGSQLFLDNTATLTLRNMVVDIQRSYPGKPGISLSSNTSKLALDNVMLSLNDDLYINRGSLFIHNDVMVTGTSALVYRSTSPSYIASHGCLSFDLGTTFSYAPACTNKDLIVMADASSTLALNGCSLKATHTGLRLTKGRLYFDDHVTLDSAATNQLDSVTTATWLNWGGDSSIIYSVSWSPDGTYLAGVGRLPNGGSELQIYRFNGSILTLVDSQSYGDDSASCVIYSISWSSDGQYLAIGGDGAGVGGGFNNTDQLRIYKFDGSTLTAVTSRDYGGSIRSVTWSPDGKYVAIGGSSPVNGAGGFSDTNELRIYRFNGSTLAAVTSQDYGDSIRSVAWSPDGKILAIVGMTPANGAGGFSNTNELRIYRFDETTLTPVTSQDYGTSVNTTCESVSWSPNGKDLAIGGGYAASVGGFSTANELRIYRFNGSTLTAVASQAYGSGSYVFSVSWSSDGNYLGIGSRSTTSGNELRVDRCNYKNETATQAISNSIVFGNRALGSAYDLDVHVLSGARVEVNGSIFHDPA